MQESSVNSVPAIAINNISDHDDIEASVEDVSINTNSSPAVVSRSYNQASSNGDTLISTSNTIPKSHPGQLYLHPSGSRSESSTLSTSSFTSTILGIGADTGRFLKFLGESVIALADETAIQASFWNIRRQLKDREKIDALLDNPKSFKSFLDSLYTIIEFGKLNDRPKILKFCEDSIFIISHITMSGPIQPICIFLDFYIKVSRFGVASNLLIVINVAIAVNLKNIKKQLNNLKDHSKNDIVSGLTRSLCDLMDLHISFHDSDNNRFIRVMSIITSLGDIPVQQIRQIDLENPFLENFLVTLKDWIEKTYPNHQLCYFFMWLTHLHDTPTKFYHRGNACVLGLDNPVQCRTGNFIYNVSEDFSANFKVFNIFHELRQGDVPYSDILTLCKDPDMKSLLLANGVREELFSLFPTSNKERRWRFEMRHSLSDAVDAIDILFKLKVLGWETVLQCLLIRGHSIHDINSSEELQFDSDIYIWGLWIFCRSVQVQHMFENAKVFSCLIAWLELDENEFDGIRTTLNMDILYLSESPDYQPWAWMGECNGTPEQIEELKIYLRKQLRDELKRVKSKFLREQWYTLVDRVKAQKIS